MVIANQDRTIARGADVVIPFVIEDDAGDPEDITDWDIEATFRDRSNSVVKATLTIGDGITITDAASGEGTLNLTSEQTGDMIGVQDFSVWRVDSGSERDLIIGTLTVERTSRG